MDKSLPQRLTLGAQRPSWPTLWVILCACALLISACSERYSPAPTAAPTPPPAVTASLARVFDAGDRPQPLWPDVAPGWRQQLTWHPLIDQRPWAVRAEVEVLEVRPNGAWLVEQRVIAAMPTDGGAAPAAFDSASLTRQWELTPNGSLPSLDADSLPAPLPALHAQLQQLALQIPTEPIGEGAFWDAALADGLSVGVVLEARTAEEVRVRVDWPADPSLSTVRLLWAGQEPRRVLRYQPTVGQEERAVIALRDATTYTDTRAAISLPVGRSTLSLRVLEGGADSADSADGAVRFEGESSSDANPEPIPFTGALALGQGVARGSVTDAPPRAAAWQGAQPGEQVVVGLPREAVGVGARWAVRSPVVAGPWTLQRVAIYTVEKVEGDTLWLRVDGKQYGRDLPLSVDGPRKRLDATLHALEADERGTLKLDLHRLIPEAELSLELHLWVVPRGSERPTVTHTKAKLSISPEVSAPKPK